MRQTSKIKQLLVHSNLEFRVDNIGFIELYIAKREGNFMAMFDGKSVANVIDAAYKYFNKKSNQPIKQ